MPLLHKVKSLLPIAIAWPDTEGNLSQSSFVQLHFQAPDFWPFTVGQSTSDGEQSSGDFLERIANHNRQLECGNEQLSKAEAAVQSDKGLLLVKERHPGISWCRPACASSVDLICLHVIIGLTHSLPASRNSFFSQEGLACCFE